MRPIRYRPAGLLLATANDDLPALSAIGRHTLEALAAETV